MKKKILGVPKPSYMSYNNNIHKHRYSLHKRTMV